MTLTVNGHVVRTCACAGLRDNWRVTADGEFIGMIYRDAAGAYTTVPGRSGAPIAHPATPRLCCTTPVAETVDHR